MPDPITIAGRLTQPSNLDLGVWRYMALGQFVWMLLYKQLWLAPITRLEDKFEGIATARVVAEILASANLSAYGYPLGADRGAALREIRQRIFVSCWHLSNTENHVMWKAYGTEGLVIRTTYRKLRDSVGGLPVGLVAYEDFANYRGAFDPMLAAWLKRDAFASEQEVRIGLYSAWLRDLEPAGSGEYYGMPITWPLETIERVIVHPESDYEHIRAITDLGRRLSPELPDPIVAYSSLAAAPPY